MIKVLRNNIDKSIYFEDIEKAKYYYTGNMEDDIATTAEECPELLDDTKERYKRILEAEDMDELAEALNYKTDDLDNGSHWYVEEV